MTDDYDKNELQNLVRDLQRLFLLSLDMICVAGTDGYFKKINPAFTEVLGYSEEELLARPFLDFVHPDDVESTAAEIEKLGQGTTTLLFENRYRCADGSWKWIAWKSVPVPMEQIVYAVGRDVTALKAGEAELAAARDAALEASRLKSRFLASVSHELRTPLNSIIGFSELLLEETPGPLNHDQKACVIDIYHSGHHLLNLINDILDLSRIEAGRMEIEPEAFDLEELLRDTLSRMRPLAEKKKQRLTVTVEEDLGAAWADPEKVNQVVINLVGNAVKFTDEGGRIEVRARQPEGARLLQVEVEDNGVGIASEKTELIFDEFRQVDDNHIERQEGSGLGLALCLQLLRLMDGEIAVRSEPGRGSVFTFTLPAADTP